MRIFLRYSLILLVTAWVFSIEAVAQETFSSEKEMKKQANALFEEEEFIKAYPLFSQLVSVYPKDPSYNYKYGVCLLYYHPDKEKAIFHLELAVKSPEVEKEVFFYQGKAYHLNYRFDDAIKAYRNYQQKASVKEIERYQVGRQIEMCNNGKQLLRNISDLQVMDRKELSREVFFRSYDLSDFKTGKLVVKPEDFKTPLDKKKKDNSILYIDQSQDKLFYSSYGENAKSKDIYMRKRTPQGDWGTPELLTGPINTPYDEDYPFLHPNGKILYFSSKGHNSMGGYDIFKSEYDAATNTWSNPVNMDFAINTPDDDFLFISDAADETGYFSSTRASNGDLITIYKVKIENKVAEIAIIKGKVKSEDGQTNLQVKISITDMANAKPLLVKVSDEGTGDYLLELPNGGKFLFDVEAKGYKKTSVSVELPVLQELKPIAQIITLYKEDGHSKIKLENKFNEAVTDADYVSAMKALKDHAKLEVNYDPAREAAIAANNANASDIDSLGEVAPVVDSSKFKSRISNEDIIKIAYQDARDVQKEASDLERSSKNAYVIANQRNEEAQQKKHEAEEISAGLSKITDEDRKKSEQERVLQLQKESDQFAQQTIITHSLAQKLERDARKKQVKADYYLKHAKALEQAIVSKSNAKVSRLTEQKEAYDASVKPPSTQEPFAELVSASAEKENLVERSKHKQDEVTAELKDLKTELERVKQDEAKAKNKDLKLALQNQANDLTTDIAAKEKELVTLQSDFNTKQLDAKGLKNQADYIEQLLTKLAIDTILGASSYAAIDRGKLDEKVKEYRENPATKIEILADNTGVMEEAEPPVPDTELAVSPGKTSAKAAKNEKSKPAKENTSATKSGKTDKQKSATAAKQTDKSDPQKNANSVSKDTSTTTTAITKNTDDPAVPPVDKENANGDAAEATATKTPLNTEDKPVTDNTNTNQGTTIQKEQPASELPVATAVTNENEQEAENKAIFNTLTDNTNVPVAYATFYGDKLAATEQLKDSYLRESIKEKIYSNWLEQLKMERDSVFILFASTKNKKDKATLQLAIDSLDKLIVEKQALVAESATAARLAKEERLVTTSSPTTPVTNNVNPTTTTTTNTNTNTNTANTVTQAKSSDNATKSAVQIDNVLATNASFYNNQLTKMNTIPDLKERNSKKQEVLKNWVASLNISRDSLRNKINEAEDDKTTIALTTQLNRLDIELADKQTQYNDLVRESNSIQPGSVATTVSATENDAVKNSNASPETDNKPTESPTPVNTITIADVEQSKQLTSSTQKQVELVNYSSTQSADKAKEGNALLEESKQLDEQLNKQLIQLTVVTTEAEKQQIQAKITELKNQSDNKKNSGYAVIVGANQNEYDKNNQQIDQLARKVGATKSPAIQQAEKLNKDADEKYKLAEAENANSQTLTGFEKQTALKKAIVYQLQAIETKQKAKDLLLNTLAGVPQETLVENTNNAGNPETAPVDSPASDKIAPASPANNTVAKTPDPVNAPVQSSQKPYTPQEFKVYNDLMLENNKLSTSAKLKFAEAQELKTQSLQAYEKSEELANLANATDDPTKKQRLQIQAEDLKQQSLTKQSRSDSLITIASAEDARAVDRKVQAQNYLKKQNPEKSAAMLAYYNLIYNVKETTDTPVVPPTETALTNLPPVVVPQVNNPVEKKETPAIITTADAPKSALLSEKFEINNSIVYSDANPIPIDPALPEGMLFKVQVGAFRNRIPQNTFKGISPLMGETTTNGFIRYSAGLFVSLPNATAARDRIRSMGYKDAFVVAFYNGKRISYDQALAMINKTTNTTDNPLAITDVQETKPKVTNIPVTPAQPTDREIPQTQTTIEDTKPTTIGATLVNDIKSTDVKSVNGLFYTVQVGVYSKKVTKGQLFGIDPLNSEFTTNGLVRYTSGVYTDIVKANSAKTTIMQKGVKDAFVTAYYNGKRISPNEAAALIAAKGNGVFANAEKQVVDNNPPLITNEQENKQQPAVATEKIPTAPKEEKQVPKTEEDTIRQTAPTIDVPPSERQNADTAATERFIPDVPYAAIPNSAKEDSVGIVFKVQIGAFKDEVPIEIANKFLRIQSQGIKNNKENELIVYTVGSFTDYNEAVKVKNAVSEQGIRDAFVIAFKDGKKIDIEQARKLSGPQ